MLSACRSSLALQRPRLTPSWSGFMTEQRTHVISIGEVMIEMARGCRWPFQPGLRRGYVQHRGLSRPARAAGHLRHRARRRPLFRPDRCPRLSRRHRNRPGRAGARAGAGALSHRNRRARANAPSSIGVTPRRRVSCSSCRNGPASPKASLAHASSTSPGSRFRSIPTPALAASSPFWKWRGRPAQRWCSTAITGRADGKAMCSGPAGCSWKPSSASISRCRLMRTKRCCGAISP